MSDKVKVKAGDLPRIREAITQLTRERLPMRAVLRVVRVGQAIDVEVAALSASVDALNEQHVVRENGVPVRAGPDGFKVQDPTAYAAELRELYAQEVEVPPLRISEWGVDWEADGESALAGALIGLGPVLVLDVPDAAASARP